MILKLKIGNKFSDIEVVQDAKYPSMWRVRRADGSLSDMVNLARAKDAALSAAHMGGGLIASWHPRQTAAGRPPIAPIGLTDGYCPQESKSILEAA